MSIKNALIISLLVITILAVPVLADNGMTLEKNPFNPAGTPATVSTQGYTPQTSYTNYFYLFNHGSLAFTEMPNSYVSSQYSMYYGHYTYLVNAPSSTVNATAYVDLPVTGIASYSGVHPLVRYIFIRTGSYTNRGAIDTIWTFSGDIQKTNQHVYIDGNGAVTETTVDLGSYHDYVRGMDIVCHIYNSNTGAGGLNVISGYGAKAEW